jgi:hypothetical protein
MKWNCLQDGKLAWPNGQDGKECETNDETCKSAKVAPAENQDTIPSAHYSTVSHGSEYKEICLSQEYEGDHRHT